MKILNHNHNLWLEISAQIIIARIMEITTLTTIIIITITVDNIDYNDQIDESESSSQSLISGSRSLRRSLLQGESRGNDHNYVYWSAHNHSSADEENHNDKTTNSDLRGLAWGQPRSIPAL